MYTPLYSALIELSEKKQISFHMPGHFEGKAMEGFDDLLKIDTTEVPESDNLFAPQGPIAMAEAAAAGFFGAKETRFLVNGSSAGVLAAVGAVCKDGDKIICDRFCHRSLIAALVFSGAVPIWLYPETIDNGLLWGGIDPKDVEKAICENPDAKAVFITSPNYFGLSSDVKAIADITHSHNIPLLLDGAHGAHYGISPLLPPSPVSLGADLVIAGAHKTLPSVTQSAYLHINGSFPRLDDMLRMYQTSSPSYILMASLDYARGKMEEQGLELWSDIARAAGEIFPEQAEPKGRYSKYKDICRLVLPTGGNPFEAAERLRLEKGISVECSYGGGVVCILNTAHRREDLVTLRDALCDVRRTKSVPIAFAPIRSRQIMSPREAFFSQTEAVSLTKALGRICSREVMVYPPGAAQLLPGEEVSASAINGLQKLVVTGCDVHGLNNGRIWVTR